MIPQPHLKLTTLFLFQIISVTLLFAQAPLKETSPENSGVQFPEARAYSNTVLTYQIIDAPKNTFCYDVYAGARLMIHQTSVPGLPGNEGFKTRDDAVKVAELVIEKIRKGEMPPTVSIDEMKKLDVIK